ncbi:polysaccharide biosynthesis/export family protein [Niveispirillum sp. KHB5.9]|uniref:polysaccharide biosynthesis/export family protein n=1 Tax=Niveispirillum sp. KHB5.9 TaxID=3400269 RepID=UPI003A8BB260
MAPGSTINATEGYQLEPGNRVRVTVFNEPSLSGDFTLDPVGNINMPPVGNVPSAGLTGKQLAVRVEKYLSRNRFVQTPNVSVESRPSAPSM